MLHAGFQKAELGLQEAREQPQRRRRRCAVQRQQPQLPVGVLDLQPQRIDPGFTVAHLTFGPQERRAAPGLVSEWRKLYADISRQYLGEGR